MKAYFQFLLFLISLTSFSQRSKIIEQYKHHSIFLKNDTINYHTYQKNDASINTVLIYLQGSSAKSLYQVKKEEGRVWVGTSIPFDFNLLPENYLFVVISKKGFPFQTKMDEKFDIPNSYFENQTLEYRANQADFVIKDLLKKDMYSFDKIIALGHSEGSDVVAKLGTINNVISHFGYWSGGGNTQFIDFITFIRKKADAGKITELEAQKEINKLFVRLKDIMNNPNETNKFWSGKTNSYKRWSHFSEPPIKNLLQIDKPLFVAIGTKDQSVAVESAYLIPIEFIRNQKENLTFKAYPNLDHSFGEKLNTGKFKEHWNDVFKEFLVWVNK